MLRNLKREREIALSLHPLTMWSPEPDRRPSRFASRRGLTWLRQQRTIAVNIVQEFLSRV
jgi:hypothetical protein